MFNPIIINNFEFRKKSNQEYLLGCKTIYSMIEKLKKKKKKKKKEKKL